MTAPGTNETKYEFSPREFQRFRDFLQKACGIDLAHSKQYLVVTRIRPILRENGLANLTGLLERMEQDADRRLRQQVIDAMTTNETFWFRDSYPFEFVAESLLPSLQERKGNLPVRIWSAACSSGQEPYSISILVEEVIRNGCGRFSRPVEIVATDVSNRILAQARTGQYDRLSLARGLSEDRLQKFFQPIGGDCWQINSPVRSRVDFKPLNLQDAYFFLGKFDIVFCRNVLIYFSTPLKHKILRKIHNVMAPGGHLFLGSSESLGDASELFDMVHCNPGVAYIAK